MNNSSAKPAPESINVRVEVDRSVLPSDKVEKAVIKVSLDGVRLTRPESRPPVNLALALDRSGSMQGDNLDQAKAAAIEALRRLRPDDLFSLVVYNGEVNTLIPAGRVGSGQESEACIRGICAGGNTALFGGVSQGAAELRKNLENRGYIHRLILLSDGLANVGLSSPEALARLGSALLKEGISVTTIGLGLGFNEDLMTGLAQKSDGNTYFVESSVDLPRIFNAELGDILNVVARQVTIEVEFPEGVRPDRIVGREGKIQGQKALITLNQIYGGQEKFALIEVEVGANRAGTEKDIALAKVRFENLTNQCKTSVSAKVSVRFDSDKEAVQRSTQTQVQSDYAANVMAEAKDKVVELVDADRCADAAQELRARVAQVHAMGVASGNEKVVELAKQQAAEADKVEREGLDNARRKTYRAQNAQTWTQQTAIYG